MKQLYQGAILALLFFLPLPAVAWQLYLVWTLYGILFSND